MSNTSIFLLATIACIPLLLLVPWGWRRIWKDETASHTSRFIKNSSIPILANLFSKVLDLGFAAITLRALGPMASGAWSFVALIASMYLVTIVNWGLNDLAVRESAAHPTRAPHLFGISLSMRWVMAAVVTPLTLLAFWLMRDIMPPLTTGSTVALWLLLAHLWPAGTAAAASASFQAAQRMEIPALVTVIASITRTLIGVAVIWWLSDSDARIVGMAAVALATTCLNAIVLWYLQHRMLFAARPLWDWQEMRQLWGAGVPLLLNSLLLTIFFRFDAVILRSVSGDYVLGLYDAAYKVISMTQIIPPYVVGALFPLLAHRAVHQRDELAPLVVRAVTLLQWLAWMGVVLVMILADQLIWILGGDAYLPDAAYTLRVLIWYLPLSYITGVLQYALIAIQQQKTITVAFMIGTLVNISCNIVLIPHYGALAAASVTVATEIALMAAIWPTLRHAGIQLPWQAMGLAGGSTVVVVALSWGGIQFAGIPVIVSAIGALCVMLGVGGYSERHNPLIQRAYARIRALTTR